MPGAWSWFQRGGVNGLSRSFFLTLKVLGLPKIAAYVALSLASALAGGLAALFVVPLIQPGDVAWLGSHGHVLTSSMDMCALFFLCASVTFALARWQAARLAARLASHYGMQLRARVHESLVEARLSSLVDATSAELANVLTHNVEIVTQGFSALLQLLVAGITTVVSLALALWVSPTLVMAVPVIAACSLISARFRSREHAAVSRQYVADMTRLFWMSEDFPRRWRHIKSFGQEDAEKRSHAASSARLGHGYRRQLELIASGRLVLELLAAIGIALIFLVAHHWKSVDQASLIAVCLLLGRLLPYMVSTRQSFHQLASAVPAFELWSRYADAAAPSSSPVFASRQTHGTPPVWIEELTLAEPVRLRITDLWLRPGELLLVSGDSGIGKTSLADVLAGMIRPSTFTAWLDGRRLDFDAYAAWVRHGAYLSQNVRPWQRTVRECLRWADADASDETMQAALTDVGLERRLAGTSCGLEATLDGSSGRLSGGELQRLLLAQVLLRQPVLAILDEATNALDAAAENRVLATLRQKLPGSILIVISHRNTVAGLADQNLVISADLIATVRQKELPELARRDAACVAEAGHTRTTSG